LTIFSKNIAAVKFRGRLSAQSGECERAAKDISLKMETYVCTMKAKIPLRKANFPVLANLSFHRSPFEKEIYVYIFLG